MQNVLIWYDRVATRVFFHNFPSVFCFHRIHIWKKNVQTIILFIFYIRLSIYDNFSFQWNRLCFFHRNLLFNQVKNAWLLMKSRKTCPNHFFDKMCDCSIKKKTREKNRRDDSIIFYFECDWKLQNSKIKHTKLDHVFNAFNQNWLNMKWMFLFCCVLSWCMRCLFKKNKQSVVVHSIKWRIENKKTKSNLIMPNFHLMACCKQTKPEFDYL